MSLWKKISPGVLISILLLLGPVVFLVGTASDLHLVFKVANRWVLGLKIGQVAGDWRDLSLKNIYYDQPDVAVNAGRMHLAMGLNCLWGSGLYVNDLALKNINVTIDSEKMPPPASVEEEESSPLNLSTLHPVTLSRVALNNTNIKIDDTTISVLDFISGLNW